MKRYLLLPFVMVLLYSCKEQSIVDELNDNASENGMLSSAQYSANGFNYENCKETTFYLKFMDNDNKPMKSLNIEVYAENPLDSKGYTIRSNASVCFKSSTDLEGMLKTTFSFPLSLDSVYVHIMSPFYKEVIAYKKRALISDIIYPVGFGSKNNVLRKAATDPKLYTKNSTRLPNSANLYVLGDYNGTNGTPLYLLGANENIPAPLITRINAALPPGTSNPATFRPNVHPEWFSNNDLTNINITATAHAWITFLSEGAGVNNTLGYFYYPTNSPPATSADINKRIVIFPNASANGSGGGLYAGNTILLKYYNEDTSTWEDTFPPGITISWFVATDGWGGSGASSALANNWINQFSLKNLNYGNKAQSIILYDETYQKLVLAFEDVSCNDVNGANKIASDQDFNDVIFIVRTDPVTAVDLSPFPKLSGGDKDGDGTLDVFDDYPNDPARAKNNYYPSSSGFGSLAFEDNWPAKGDYDFNDMVVDYQVKYVTNTAGLVKDIIPTIRLKAIGAQYQNGFAIELNTTPNNIELVTTTYNGSENLLPKIVFDETNGVENGTLKAVIPFFENAFKLYGSNYIAGYPNTLNVQHAYVDLTKKITFTTPVSTTTLGSPPYNPFIVVNQDRGREVHKAGKRPTSKANIAYFKTQDDLTDQNTLWYVGTQSYPWVMDTPATLEYPIAGQNIQNVFLKVSSWVTSAGTLNTDWYSNKAAGYRDTKKIWVWK